MNNIYIQKNHFLAHESIPIHADNLFDAAFLFGKKTRHLIKKKIYNHVQSVFLLKEMEKISKSNIFVINGINWLDRYMQTLYGFTKGAGMTPEESAFLQSYGDTSCQTIYVQNKRTKNIQIIHIEENGDDTELIELHKKDEGLSHNPHATYVYRLVDFRVNGDEGMFFACPGLCWGGATFAIQKTKQAFIAVDTLFISDHQTVNALWASAIASMIFDCGRIEIADAIVSAITAFGIECYGGYAIHLCELDTKQMTSYEFGNTTAVKILPKETNDRLIIAQTNYPVQKDLRAIHSAEAQVSLGISRRSEILTKTAEHLKFYETNTDTIDSLKKIISNPRGDIETMDGVQSISGFVNIYEAGYVLGSISDNADFLIGKMAPPPLPDEPYYRFYDPKKPESARFAQMDLLAQVSKMKSTK